MQGFEGAGVRVWGIECPVLLEFFRMISLAATCHLRLYSTVQARRQGETIRNYESAHKVSINIDRASNPRRRLCRAGLEDAGGFFHSQE